jgi:hypothetical protein
MESPICLNCGEPLAKVYCPSCGQKASVRRIAVPDLVREIPHAIFHLDNGFLFNLRQLFRQPGRSIREYLEGRRKPYFHPLTYLILALVFNYLAVKITDLHYYDEAELHRMSAAEAALIMEYDATQWWFLEHTYLYVLLAISIASVALFLFFRLVGQRFNLAETVVIISFTIAQGVIMQSIIYFLTGWVRSGPFIRAVEVVNIALLFAYASYAMYSLLRSGPQPVRRPAGLPLSILAGGGLLAIMIWSAYALYGISH